MSSLTSRGPAQSSGDIHHIGDDGLHTIAFTFDLCHETRHLVPVLWNRRDRRSVSGSLDLLASFRRVLLPVEGILHIPVDVQSHDDG